MGAEGQEHGCRQRVEARGLRHRGTEDVHGGTRTGAQRFRHRDERPRDRGTVAVHRGTEVCMSGSCVDIGQGHADVDVGQGHRGTSMEAQ